MHRTTWIFVFAAAGILCRADQITLKNGDRLTGSLLKTDAKTLVFKSEFAGQVTIPWEVVTGLETTQAVYVGLKGAQAVAGPLSLSEDRAEVHSAAAGVVTAPRANIVYIRSSDEQQAYDKEIDRYRNPRMVDLWTGFVDLGLSQARGNARTSTVSTGASANRVTSRDKIEVNFTSLYSSNSTTGVELVTANAIRGGIRYNLNVSPKTFVFAATDLEYDQFQDLDLRFTPTGGMGYHAWKGEHVFLDLSGGVALNREFFSTGLNRTSAEAALGEELVCKLNSRTNLRQKLAVSPNLSSGGDYRMNFDTSADTVLWRWFRWQFTFSDRLISNPVPGRKKNDLLFTTGLRLSFAK